MGKLTLGIRPRRRARQKLDAASSRCPTSDEAAKDRILPVRIVRASSPASRNFRISDTMTAAITRLGTKGGFRREKEREREREREGERERAEPMREPSRVRVELTR